MLKKTIKYTDYFGTEREEDFYFDINTSELIEMQHSEIGGMKMLLDKIVAAQDNVALFKYFKSFVLKSYGVKSDDGRRFIKDEKLTKEFTQTPAYDILMSELCTDADKAAEFVNSIIPKQIENK